jgi:hypothetical protein
MGYGSHLQNERKAGCLEPLYDMHVKEILTKILPLGAALSDFVNKLVFFLQECSVNAEGKPMIVKLTPTQRTRRIN